MALGDNRFNLSRITLAFDANSVQVPVTRSRANVATPRDKFGKPTGAPDTATIEVLISNAELEIIATEAGGKPKEVLEFYVLSGTLSENDELTWSGHVFRTTSTYPFGFGGQQLVLCKAEREVDN